jgi:UDP-glucose 4-epimerase
MVQLLLEAGHEPVTLDNLSTGHTVDCEVQARRAGDPPQLVADANLARQGLNWAPRFSDMDAIIETAWRFHKEL